MLQDLKNENQFLKDYVHRLNAATSEYQSLNPPKSLEKEIKVNSLMIEIDYFAFFLLLLQKEQRRMGSLPSSGPLPSWLVRKLAEEFIINSSMNFV